ncbi:putative extracellular protein [Phytophthora megakarya]|uniref:Putative extracellular protein n=1 Tax=Phytophthora megakarya TaxID=4795 RepID=A0A225V2I8_9STRA|nr:putative extracellular protein [Phytophthora megakarya]
MQPCESASDPATANGDPETSEKRDALHKSLMEVVAKQASNELSLPRIAAHKKLHQRGARLTALSRELTLEELRPHFGRPIVEVAREFGICTTFLKKICRRCGIKRWPHRQIRSLNRTIEMLEQVESVAKNPEDKDKYAAQIEELKEKQRAVMEDPDTNGKLKRMKKYSTPRGVSDALSTPVGQSFILRAQTIDNDGKTLSALAVVVDSVPGVPSTGGGTSGTTQIASAAGSSPLGMKIHSSVLSRELTLEELRPHFGRPIVEVAREFVLTSRWVHGCQA